MSKFRFTYATKTFAKKILTVEQLDKEAVLCYPQESIWGPRQLGHFGGDMFVRISFSIALVLGLYFLPQRAQSSQDPGAAFCQESLAPDLYAQHAHGIGQTLSISRAIDYIKKFSGKVPGDSGFVLNDRGESVRRSIARFWLIDELHKLGYSAEVENFGSGANIIAERPGTTKDNEIIEITAHFDSVGNPGADDNLSSVGVILAALEHFEKVVSERRIRVIFTDLEEQGQQGSRAHARKILSQKDRKVIGTLVVDTIGWMHPNAPKFLGVLEIGTNRHFYDKYPAQYAFAQDLYYVYRRIGNREGLFLSPEFDEALPWTADHGSYWFEKLPAVLFAAAYTHQFINPNYHKGTDQLEGMNLEYYREMGQLVVELLAFAARSKFKDPNYLSSKNWEVLAELENKNIQQKASDLFLPEARRDEFLAPEQKRDTGYSSWRSSRDDYDHDYDRDYETEEQKPSRLRPRPSEVVRPVEGLESSPIYISRYVEAIRESKDGVPYMVVMPKFKDDDGIEKNDGFISTGTHRMQDLRRDSDKSFDFLRKEIIKKKGRIYKLKYLRARTTPLKLWEVGDPLSKVMKEDLRSHATADWSIELEDTPQPVSQDQTSSVEKAIQLLRSKNSAEYVLVILPKFFSKVDNTLRAPAFITNGFPPLMDFPNTSDEDIKKLTQAIWASGGRVYKMEGPEPEKISSYAVAAGLSTRLGGHSHVIIFDKFKFELLPGPERKKVDVVSDESSKTVFEEFAGKSDYVLKTLEFIRNSNYPPVMGYIKSTAEGAPANHGFVYVTGFAAMSLENEVDETFEIMKNEVIKKGGSVFLVETSLQNVDVESARGWALTALGRKDGKHSGAMFQVTRLHPELPSQGKPFEMPPAQFWDGLPDRFSALRGEDLSKVSLGYMSLESGNQHMTAVLGGKMFASWILPHTFASTLSKTVLHAGGRVYEMLKPKAAVFTPGELLALINHAESVGLKESFDRDGWVIRRVMDLDGVKTRNGQSPQTSQSAAGEQKIPEVFWKTIGNELATLKDRNLKDVSLIVVDLNNGATYLAAVINKKIVALGSVRPEQADTLVKAVLSATGKSYKFIGQSTRFPGLDYVIREIEQLDSSGKQEIVNGELSLRRLTLESWAAPVQETAKTSPTPANTSSEQKIPEIFVRLDSRKLNEVSVGVVRRSENDLAVFIVVNKTMVQIAYNVSNADADALVRAITHGGGRAYQFVGQDVVVKYLRPNEALSYINWIDSNYTEKLTPVVGVNICRIGAPAGSECSTNTSATIPSQVVTVIEKEKPAPEVQVSKNAKSNRKLPAAVAKYLDETTAGDGVLVIAKKTESWGQAFGYSKKTGEIVQFGATDEAFQTMLSAEFKKKSHLSYLATLPMSILFDSKMLRDRLRAFDNGQTDKFTVDGIKFEKF